MRKGVIFGVAGQLGSGKDTVCKILTDFNIVKKENIVGFAKGVKECAQEYFDIPVTERSTKSRMAWQRIGDIFRELHFDLHGNKDIWLNYLFKKLDEDTNYAISDVRYSNEMQRILDEGGILVYIQVDESLRRKRVEERRNKSIDDNEWKTMNSHQSEHHVDPYTFDSLIKPSLYPQDRIITLDNNLEDLRELERRIWKRFVGLSLKP